MPAQTALGLDVGVVCDSTAADRLTEARLGELSKHLTLGLHRIPMRRTVGLGDYAAYKTVLDVAASCKANILHGHGAKGGAYARLAARRLTKGGQKAASFYTPHGGSLNYPPTTLKGRVYMALERHLEAMTGGIVFESAWSERIYRGQVCEPKCAVRVIPNGVLPGDFVPHQPALDAHDIVFVGELRYAKGIDLLLEAIAAVRIKRPVRALIVGDGPDCGILKAQAVALGLSDCVTFPGAMPARKAFDMGRLLVIPSRWESFPYIVLEAGAAGIPIITTEVGGIPEITTGTDTPLVPSGDVVALADAILRDAGAPEAAVERAQRLRAHVQAKFTVDKMARDVVDLYRFVSV